MRKILAKVAPEGAGEGSSKSPPKDGGPDRAIPSTSGASETAICKGPLDFRHLERVARDLAQNSLAPLTKRTYASGQKRYLVFFCQRSSLSPFPLAEDQLCSFVAHLAEEGLQHTSIKGYLSAIQHLQILGGMGDPFAASWPLLEYTLRGLKLWQAKSKVTRAKTRLSITPNILRLILHIYSTSQPA